jgi:hypothetical protein
MDVVADGRVWYFERGSASVADIQKALADAVPTALNSESFRVEYLAEDDALLISDDDPGSADVRDAPMTAKSSGDGFDPQATEVVIRIGSALTIAAAREIWKRFVLPGLKKWHGDDAVGRETTERHAVEGQQPHL